MANISNIIINIFDFITFPFRWVFKKIASFLNWLNPKPPLVIKKPKKIINKPKKSEPVRPSVPYSIPTSGSADLLHSSTSNFNPSSNTQKSSTRVLSNKLLKLVQNQQDTYQTIFLQYPTDFHQPTHHYDWWMFPIEAPKGTSETSQQFSVNNKDVKKLLYHQPFILIYNQSIEAYLNNLKNYGWNHYDVRYAKMLCSLNKFILVSNTLPENNNINYNLLKLANTAIDFAQKNISTNDLFLNSALKELKNTTKNIAKIRP